MLRRRGLINNKMQKQLANLDVTAAFVRHVSVPLAARIEADFTAMLISDDHSPPVCAGDVDGNGLVNAPDLAILLSVWGTNAAGFPSADTNRDGLVNGPDLSRLLSSWGICAP